MSALVDAGAAVQKEPHTFEAVLTVLTRYVQHPTAVRAPVNRHARIEHVFERMVEAAMRSEVRDGHNSSIIGDVPRRGVVDVDASRPWPATTRQTIPKRCPLCL